MNIFDIQSLIDNSATVYTKIEVLPKVAGEEIITLTNENSVKSWVYSDLRNVEKQGFIGQFVARTLDGELQDIDDDFNIEDREIILYLGINSNHTAELVTQDNNEIITQSNEGIITEQGADVLTYYKLGNFFVEKPESDEVRDNTKFKSMDYTILFNATFNPNFKDSEYTKSFEEKIEDEETVTALWLAQYTCKQVGVTLGTTTFRNSNFVISSNQFDSGYTCRDVIKSIAKLAITWARIGWDNKLYLDFDKQTTIEDYNVITNDNYYELTTQKDVYGEVNRILMGSSIVIGNSAYVEDAQSIENNGLTELDVYDNPILYTQELRQQAITSASSMLGLMYQPVEIETTGHPWLLGNELITVVDMEGNYLNTYALDRILTYNGHIRSKINSMAKTETESTYSYQGVENNDLEIKRSRVELDRQNQTLTSVMERTTTNESQISTMTQNINGISTNITSMSGDISSLQGNVLDLSDDIEDITSSLTTITGDITDLSTDLNGLSVSFDDFYDNEYLQTIENLQDQIDGAIEFWTGDDIPTLNNAPANQWTTEALKQEHIGDVYIVLSGTAQGANYRFVKDGNTWKWLEVSDSQIGAVRELAESAMAKATANEADIIDLKATDVSLQASIDGISASVATLETNVDELGEGYDAITTAERTATGNPIVIEDCGEYLIKNLTIYGNTSQNGTPTPTNPIEVYRVEGEHTFSVESANLLNLQDDEQSIADVQISVEDNIITLNGICTASTRSAISWYRLTLPAGTYSLSCYCEGNKTTSDYSTKISLYNKTFDNLEDDYSSSQTLMLNEETQVPLYVYVGGGTIYDDFHIKIQIEEGSTVHKYSNVHIDTESFTYDLGNITLYGTGIYKDRVYYNLTDEQWYLDSYFTRTRLSVNSQTVVLQEEDENNACFEIYNLTYLDNVNEYLPIICSHFEYKGFIGHDFESALSSGVGIYKTYYIKQSNVYRGLALVVPKSIASTAQELRNWINDNIIAIYHVKNSYTKNELITDNNLISYLNYIRDNGKLYAGTMIVRDTATTGVTGDIGVNYLTDTVFNGIYASRSELKITQNGISTMVSETVSANVEDISNRVNYLGETLEQNSKDLNNKIDVINDSLTDYAKQSSLITVTNSVEEIQTALNEQILVTQQIKEDGVEKVTTTTGFTFDKDGLTIDKTGSDTKTLVDEDGMTVYSKTGSEESILLNVDSQGVQTENLHVRTFTQIGSHTRLQDYEDGTAIFYIE